MTAFAALGLNLPASGAKPVEVEIGREIWWLNQDQRGGIWINGQEKAEGGESKPEGRGRETEDGNRKTEDLAAEPAATSDPGNIFAAVRLLLKETKTGAVAGKVDRLAEELGKSPEDFTAALVTAGLKVPEKAREKPVFAEHAGEIFWFNRNAKDELWLNAKTSKYADEDKKTVRRGGGRPAKKPAGE